MSFIYLYLLFILQITEQKTKGKIFIFFLCLDFIVLLTQPAILSTESGRTVIKVGCLQPLKSRKDK